MQPPLCHRERIENKNISLREKNKYIHYLFEETYSKERIKGILEQVMPPNQRNVGPKIKRILGRKLIAHHEEINRSNTLNFTVEITSLQLKP